MSTQSFPPISRPNNMRRDLLALAAIGVVVLVASHYFKWDEVFDEWAHAHRWLGIRLNEIVFALSLMFVMFALFALRRWREARSELIERRQLEENLQLQGTALEAAANAIVITQRNGSILWVNPAFSDLTGYTRAEVVGQNLRLLKSGQHDAAFYRNLYETIHAGHVWRSEIVNRRKDGSLYTEDMTVTPVRGSGGRITHFIAIKQDITAPKRAADTLQEIQRQHRALLDNIPDIAWVKDKESRYVAVNEALGRAYKHPVEEVVGKTDFEMVPAELAERYRADDRDVMESRCRKRIEEPFEDAAGKRIWIDTIKTPIINDKDEVIGTAGIARDITERRQMEDALRESTERFQQLAENINEVFWLTDVKTSRMLYVSPAYETVWGRPCQSVYDDPKSFSSAVHPDDLPHVLVALETQAQTGHFDADYRIVRPDGTVRWIHDRGFPIRDAHGEVYRVAGIAEDVTDRKQAEESVRRSEKRYRNLFETMQEGFALCEIICDGDSKPCDFRYLEVNAAFEQIIGIKHSEAVGKTARELFPQIEDYWIDTYGKVALTGVPAHFENYLSPLDKYFEVTAFRPKPGQFAAIFLDVSERKHTQTALQDTNQRLQSALENLQTAQQQVIQQERLRALGTMASGVAHDFNNALTAVLGFSDLLLQHPHFLDDREKTRHFLELISTAAKDAGSVVNRLREFYRHREQGEAFAAIDLNELVNQAISLTQPKWRAQAESRGVAIDVRAELQPTLPVVGNAAELREALTNLILNAVDAMPSGGTIIVRTRRDGGHTALEVSDTGTGMTEEVRQRCLEPFFTTKGDHGTGLGLSMVYGILQRHQGTLDIQSELGRGTTFLIRLPHRIAKSQTPINAEHAPDVQQSLRVLIVDDEPVARRVVSEFLMADGHTVEAATDGRDALEKFQQGGFDLVVLDRAMPGLNGDQVAAAIKSTNPHTPVVMLTGFGAMMEAVGEKPAGVDFVVGKPVTVKNLRTALAKAIALPN